MTVPFQISPESQIRLDIAHALAESCPASLYETIAVTGSTARGIANADSDLDFNLWQEALPPVEARLAWLADFGLEGLQAHDTPRPDGSQWISGVYRNCAVEVGWQSLADLQATVNKLLQAATTNHRELRLGDLISSAQVLKIQSNNLLAPYQAALADYPPALERRLITETLAEARRVDFYPLAFMNGAFTLHEVSSLLQSPLEKLYRLLFARCHYWEIRWKWFNTLLPRYERIPEPVRRSYQALWQADNPLAAQRAYSAFAEAIFALVLSDYANASEFIN